MRTDHKDSRFSCLGEPKTTWAISAINGNCDALFDLHDALYSHIRPGDRIVYLGNYMGYGDNSAPCIDEILAFRRNVLSIPGMLCSDMVYLRGQQEEIWQKLLQIQFAHNPSDVLIWMLGNGLSNTLYSYGLSPHDGIEACRAGVMGLTKWTGAVREAMRRRPGHEMFGTQLVRAAYTGENTAFPVLFVHAGIDAAKTLPEQGDSFWWATHEFESINAPYLPFLKVVRGFDPSHKGMMTNCVTATIDGGCGFGGDLVCAGLNQNGEIVDILKF